MAAMLEEARALSKNAALMHDESEVMVKTKPTRETKWSDRFKELEDYKAKHGNCCVPKRYEENPQLGEWVSKQRVYYTQNQAGQKTPLTEERIKQLDSIGFTWVIDRFNTPQLQEQWSDRFQELKDYKAQHGHCCVPFNYKENPQLGSWVSRQRKLYTELQVGKKNELTEERIKQLDNIGFTWVIDRFNTPQLQEQWSNRFQELKDYKAQHGDCCVPYHYAANPKLGFWVSKQRRLYTEQHETGKKNGLTEDRFKQLDSIGFTWVVGKGRS